MELPGLIPQPNRFVRTFDDPRSTPLEALRARFGINVWDVSSASE